MENKLTEELALTEYTNWCEANGIEYDEAGMSDDEKKDYEGLKNRIVKAIQQGKAVVDGDNIIYTLSNYEGNMDGMKINVSAPTGKVFLGMDGYKETQQMHRMHGAMSALTGLDIGVFAKLKLGDWRFFQSVLTLFLSA